jgi:hypothetical protein
VRKTKVRIVGDPELAQQVMLCIQKHFEVDVRRFDRTPYRYAKSPGISYYVTIKKPKRVES